MRIKKRGSIWHVWIGGKLVSTKCRDEKAALAVARELERRHVDPAYAVARSVTLARILRDFLDYKQSEVRPATLGMYEQKAGTLARLLGPDLLLVDLTAERVDAYLKARLQERANQPRREGSKTRGEAPPARLIKRATVAKELVTLRQALKLAKRHGKWSGDLDAVLPVKFAPKYKPKTTRLSWQEAHGLLEHLPPERAAHLAFMLATGARLGESLRAERRDVDLVAGHVRLRGTKTVKSADAVPVVALIKTLLERAVRDAPNARGPMFAKWGNIRRDIAATCLRAGVPVVTPNDLRRSFASWLSEAGVQPGVLFRLMRHTNSKLVEEVYGQVSKEALRTLIDQTTARYLLGQTEQQPSFVTPTAPLPIEKPS